MSTQHEPWWRVAVRQWPAALFLASTMVLLDKYGPAIGAEPQVMRWVYAVERWPAWPDWMGLGHERRHTGEVPTRDTVALIEFTPKAFALDFGGRSPLPRGCIAQALRAMGSQLESMRANGAPIVAVDFDVTLDAEGIAASSTPTPPGVPPCVGRDADIEPALDELARRGFTVIALALERQTVGQRLGRNRFVKRVCSGTFTPGRGGVYFASSAVFSRGTLPLYEAPAEHLGPLSRAADARPPIYPSLGNLIAVARRLHAGNNAHMARDIAAMTSECRSAHRQGDGQDAAAVPLTDDIVFGVVGEQAQTSLAGAYRYGLLNFLALDTQRRDFSVDRIAELTQASITAPTAVLWLRDGSTADRFVTPKSSEDFMPGAAVHVAASLSLDDSGLRRASKFIKLLADIAAGALFSVPIALCHRWLMQRSPALPLAQRAFGLLLPIATAALVIAVAAWVSALMLPRGLWLNPIYMALGMLLHSYFDAARGLARPPDQPVRAPPTTDLGRGLTTISDWVDVPEPPPARDRHRLDQALLWTWLAVFLAVIVAGWVVAICDALKGGAS